MKICQFPEKIAAKLFSTDTNKKCFINPKPVYAF